MKAAESTDKPGKSLRVDYQYERRGTANLFMAFEPLAAWREVRVTERRTKLDFAHYLRHLLDGRYASVEKVRLVTDNLNTHNPTSLYEAFPPEEANRLLKRIDWHYTPKHGSWHAPPSGGREHGGDRIECAQPSVLG